MSTNEGQLITNAIDEVVQVFEDVTTLTDRAQAYEPNPGSMQRSSDTYWKPLQQNDTVIEGKDISGETPDGMLELSMSGSMGDYSNIWRTIPSHDMRDERTLRRAMRAGAMSLVGDMEAKGLSKAATHGAFCEAYAGAPNTPAVGTSVWRGLANSETKMYNEGVSVTSGTTSFLNGNIFTAGGERLVQDTSNLRNQIADEAYRQGQIQNQIAGVGEVFRHNRLANMTAATAVSLTVNGAQTFKPEASEPAPNGSSVNVDHRFATLNVNGVLTDVNVGDKFTFAGNKAVSLGSQKLVQEHDRTFTVVGKGSGTITISPKPIALDDATLTPVEKSYANIETSLADSAAITFLNTNAVQSNIIMANDALVLASQPITVDSDIFQGLDAEPFEAGPIRGMIGFESNLGSLTGKYRMAIWYDWQVEKPEACGVMLWGQ